MDAPAAIIAKVVTNPVQVKPRGQQTARPAAEGELLYPGDTVSGGIALVVECRDAGSVQWAILGKVSYVAGQGPDGAAEHFPLPNCRLPKVPVSTDEQHLNLLTAQRIMDAARQSGGIATDFDQKVVDAVDRELGGFDAADPMSLLRRAVALEEKDQFAAAIQSYSDLDHTWPNSRWIPDKLAELRIALSRKGGKPGAKSGQGHVAPLVIGISDYFRDDPNYQELHYAHLDAEAFAAYLKRLDPNRTIDLLTNSQATRSSIEAKLANLALQADEGATAMVFVSGHGFQDSAGSYIAAYDAHQQVGVSTAIPVSLFLSRLSGFARVYLFVDACRNQWSAAGNSVNAALKMAADKLSANPSVRPGSGELFALLGTKPGTYSTEGDRFADPTGPLAQKGHGAFTYYLLKSLYLDAAAQARKVTRGQLEQTLTREMQALKPQQVPDGGGTVGYTELLDPLMALPAAIPVRTTMQSTPFLQLAAYVPPQQAPELIPALLNRLRLSLAPSAITRGAAEQALTVYRQLNPNDQVQVRDVIRIALEDAGQRLLLNYLDGYETEPERSQFEAANEYFTLAEELVPGSPMLKARAEFNAGRARLFDFLTAGDPLQRARIFEESTRLLFDAYRDDPAPYVLNGLGIAYMENGDWPHAIGAFQDAMKLAPLWLYPRHNLALSLMRSGKAPQAIAEYQKAIRDSPTAFTLHFNLALIYQQTNQLKKADTEYRTAERLLSTAASDRKADLARLYNAQGTLAAQRRDQKKALALYQRALLQAPQLPEAVHNIALLSRPDEKEKLLRQNISYLNSRIELAQLLKQQKRNPEAIPQYEEIIRQRPEFVAARLDLAQLYLIESKTDMSDLPRALEQIRKVEQIAPAFWKTYLVKAEAARLQDQALAAAENYRAARRYAPDGAARKEIRNSEKSR